MNRIENQSRRERGSYASLFPVIGMLTASLMSEIGVFIPKTKRLEEFGLIYGDNDKQPLIVRFRNVIGLFVQTSTTVSARISGVDYLFFDFRARKGRNARKAHAMVKHGGEIYSDDGVPNMRNGTTEYFTNSRSVVNDVFIAHKDN